MLRRDVAADAVAVAGDGVDRPLVDARLAHQLLTFLAVLFRPLLKIEVVQQADGRPEIGLVAVSQLVCVPAHHGLDRQRVLKMKMILVVFRQKRPCFISFHIQLPTF